MAWLVQNLTGLVVAVLALGLMVVAHEFGHFIAARWSGMLIHEFSVGFGPPLFVVRRIGGRLRIWFLPWRRQRTVPLEATREYAALVAQYQAQGVEPREAVERASRELREVERSHQLPTIGEGTQFSFRPFIPVGGYVRIAGMEDGDDSPDGFDHKPASRRFATILAGPLMNAVLAVVVFIAMGMIFGEQTGWRPVVSTVEPGTRFADAGLRPGDRLVAIGGRRLKDLAVTFLKLTSRFPGWPIELEVMRDGRPVRIYIPSHRPTAGRTVGLIGVEWANPQSAGIGDVIPTSPADRAGIRSGDQVVEVAGHPTSTYAQVSPLIQQSAGKRVPIVVKRDGKRLRLVVTPLAARNPGIGDIGVSFPEVIRKLSPRESVVQGGLELVFYFRLAVFSIKSLLTGHAGWRDVQGPVGITRVLSQKARSGWFGFLDFAALVSLALAIANVLPLPALDGSWLVLLLGEMIFRRPLLSARKRAIVQSVGLTLLLSLFVLVAYKDILDWIKGQ